MKNYLLSFFALFLLFAACKKPAGKDVKVDSALKAAFNFKKGTYWIYKDSLTGEVDSFYVTYFVESVTATTPRNPKEAVRTETVLFEVRQETILPKEGSTTGFWKYFLQENKLTITYSDNNGKGSRTYGIIIVDYPYQPDTGLTILPSYSAAGIAFTNVAVVNSYVATKYDDYMYLSSTAGLVKMSMRHQQDKATYHDYTYRILELQRYSVTK